MVAKDLGSAKYHQRIIPANGNRVRKGMNTEDEGYYDDEL